MSTLHELKKVEWYSKLKEEYKCNFVEMEYTFRLGSLWGQKDRGINVRFDVFGMTANGEKYAVEVGKISSPKKLEKLEEYAKLFPNFHLIRVDAPLGGFRSKHAFFKEKENIDMLDYVFTEKAMLAAKEISIEMIREKAERKKDMKERFRLLKNKKIAMKRLKRKEISLEMIPVETLPQLREEVKN